ncbi:MAG TPA: hypothetical protein VIX86_11385 [Streptosporangiaceae bacterium]
MTRLWAALPRPVRAALYAALIALAALALAAATVAVMASAPRPGG